MKPLMSIALATVIATLSTTALAHKKRTTSNIFVSNSGDLSMSLVKCRTVRQLRHGWYWWRQDWRAPDIRCKETENEVIGLKTSWPANQYRGKRQWWWSGLSGEVAGFHARNSVKPLLNPENIVRVNTYTYEGVPPGLPQSGSNFIGITPNGKRAWNSAREIDEIQEIDINPRSKTFGQILTHIPVPVSDLPSIATETKGVMRPCDMSITPNGRYLWEPDIGGETVTGVDIRKKKVIAQIVLPRENPDERVIPFMLTTNNKYAIVQNFEAPFGTVSIIDVRNPKKPVHVKKLTQADGLGVNSQTGEFTPGGRYHYNISNGSPDIPGQIDVIDMRTLQIVKNIALPANCRPHDGDFTRDGKFFAVNCSGSDSIALISNRTQEVVKEVALSGTAPRGLIVR